ncbi:hypothetical protein [Streptomyces sp. NPDC087437]|uniref:hypothetical protein n=1 Tax=Streptomyces sp. NPDC087437 TaxID=3365789 RepID=UPI0038159049
MRNIAIALPGGDTYTATPEDIGRFVNRFSMVGDHWIWNGYRSASPRGFLKAKPEGVFAVGGKSMLAHRFAYAVFVGPLLPGLQVRKTCDVAYCVNPACHQGKARGGVEAPRHPFATRAPLDVPKPARRRSIPEMTDEQVEEIAGPLLDGLGPGIITGTLADQWELKDENGRAYWRLLIRTGYETFQTVYYSPLSGFGLDELTVSMDMDLLVTTAGGRLHLVNVRSVHGQWAIKLLP